MIELINRSHGGLPMTRFTWQSILIDSWHESYDCQVENRVIGPTMDTILGFSSRKIHLSWVQPEAAIGDACEPGPSWSTTRNEKVMVDRPGSRLQCAASGTPMTYNFMFIKFIIKKWATGPSGSKFLDPTLWIYRLTICF